MIRENRNSFQGDTLVLHNHRLLHTTEVTRSNLTTSRVANEYMTAAGYDYFMPGVSDNYLGPIQLAQVSYGNGSTPFKFLGANFVPRGGLFNSTNFARSVVRTLKNGVRIGVLGIFDEGICINGVFFPFVSEFIILVAS
jgi:2',3'-cyclic-nucleotide 2'-phosphodiesterase (5'-nucleotidase family)